MSHNKNTSRNVINILSDFRNISTYTCGSYPRSYDSVVLVLLQSHPLKTMNNNN